VPAIPAWNSIPMRIEKISEPLRRLTASIILPSSIIHGPVMSRGNSGCRDRNTGGGHGSSYLDPHEEEYYAIPKAIKEGAKDIMISQVQGIITRHDDSPASPGSHTRIRGISGNFQGK